MAKIFINIGSNIGDSEAAIESAVEMIAKLWPDSTLTRAPMEKSEPWGFESENMFLNLGILVTTPYDVDPTGVFDKLQSVEASISTDSHRNPDGSYADRVIDIDLIAIDSLTVESENLTLPHPRMLEREFVMKPLRHLDPDWKHPRHNTDNA